jgi:hypothetical protein
VGRAAQRDIDDLRVGHPPGGIEHAVVGNPEIPMGAEGTGALFAGHRLLGENGLDALDFVVGGDAPVVERTQRPQELSARIEVVPLEGDAGHYPFSAPETALDRFDPVHGKPDV